MASPLASNPNVDPSLTSSPVASDSLRGLALRRFFDARVILPLVNLMRVGASPRRLAWSLAVGAAVGSNPIVSSTTLVCLAVAFIFRLNLIASQIANHLLFPLQLMLVIFWLRGGEILFHTGPLPLPGNDFVHVIRTHQWSTAHLLWTWEWHAIVVWLIAASILTPLLAAALHPFLRRLLLSLHANPTQ